MSELTDTVKQTLAKYIAAEHAFSQYAADGSGGESYWDLASAMNEAESEIEKHAAEWLAALVAKNEELEAQAKARLEGQ